MVVTSSKKSCTNFNNYERNTFLSSVNLIQMCSIFLPFLRLTLCHLSFSLSLSISLSLSLSLCVSLSVSLLFSLLFSFLLYSGSVLSSLFFSIFFSLPLPLSPSDVSEGIQGIGLAPLVAVIFAHNCTWCLTI